MIPSEAISLIGCVSICYGFLHCDGVSYQKIQKNCKTYYGITNLDQAGFLSSSYGSSWEVTYIIAPIENLLQNNGYVKYVDERWVKAYPNSSVDPSITITWTNALAMCQQPLAGATLFVPRNYADFLYLLNLVKNQNSWGASETWIGMLFDSTFGTYATSGTSTWTWMDGRPYNSYGANFTKGGPNTKPSSVDPYGRVVYKTPPSLQFDFFGTTDTRKAYVCQVVPP